MVKHIDDASSYKLLRVSCARVKRGCAIVTYFRQWRRRNKTRIISQFLFRKMGEENVNDRTTVLQLAIGGSKTKLI